MCPIMIQCMKINGLSIIELHLHNSNCANKFLKISDYKKPIIFNLLHTMKNTRRNHIEWTYNIQKKPIIFNLLHTMKNARRNHIEWTYNIQNGSQNECSLWVNWRHVCRLKVARATIGVTLSFLNWYKSLCNQHVEQYSAWLRQVMQCLEKF